ncbi:HNH endonuclease [Clostridium sp. YIM B02500]|uniref:HNH endonuclease n=1 Tax=Clostridium sp. YIM B02500 TaxID=2910681 RepID=UPI001EEDB214|nr:HNH endonuclease [Clostridium sp. YIM B02500]
MAREFAKAFYNSIAWKKCKKGFIKSVYGLCNRCGKPGKIVHHKVVLTPSNINDPSVTLNWNKLEYLCQDCHNKEHMSKYKAIRDDVTFDDEGNLIKIADEDE